MSFQQQIDRAWFEQKMARAGLTVRALARRIPMDPAALSRTLNAKRRMQLPEVRRIAEILGTTEHEVMAHASVPRPSATTPAQPAPSRDGKRHPAWGIWSGRVIVRPDYDYTQPVEPEWGALNDPE